MADLTKMMFVRPKNCEYCGHGYYGLLHVVEYAEGMGLWDIIDLSAEQAVQSDVYTALDTYDPFGFYGFGHGNDCVFTGDTMEAIFTCAECDKLSGRIVYLLSCLTGNGLGPAIIDAGAIAFAGYTENWTWMTASGTNGDPYDDIYAHGFWESGNELWMALIDGLTFVECLQACIDKYNEWIDYWFYDNPGDPYAVDAIAWLTVDRDALIGLNNCDMITNQIECENYGCYWYNNSCHGTSPPCEYYNNQTDCVNAGCYWYNNTCHELPPICEDYNNQSECENAGCYWYNDTCNQLEPTCGEYTNQIDCENAGCYWWDETCHAQQKSDCVHHWVVEIVENEICTWVSDKGGPNVLTITDIFEFIDAYILNIPPEGYSFIPTIENVFGIIDYYLGFNGDSGTGCNFYG